MKKFSRGIGVPAMILACVFAATCLPASAQYTPPAAAPSPPPNAQPYPSPPPSPSVVNTSPFAGVTAMGQTLAAMGQTLKDNGVYLQLAYEYNLNSLVSGGLKTGTIPNGELSFGTVLDLQKIAGIRGASVHVTFDERSGFGLNGLAGTQGSLEANIGPTRSIRLSELFWQQAFYDDRIDIKVGRTSPTLDFATSDVSCEFVIGIICSQPFTWYFSNENNAYPAASWGGFVNLQPVRNIYFRIGVYDDDPSNGGTNGFTWNVEHSVGVFVPAELGYQTNFNDARYPAKYDVGAYWDAASYTTPQGVPMQGRTAVYAQAQQTIWRPDPATRQSLTLFGGGIVYNGGAPYWGQYYAGLLDRAPIVQRPGDTIGLIGSYYANNSNEMPHKPTQWTFELNYGIGIVQGLTLKPYTQYVIAPNNFLAPAGSKQPSNAWVLGFQVTINVAQFLGFPVFTAY
ncbi:MAG TPA: carbohydrate porin [Rhodopila sp.]|jgi:carbohydrate-selective porin OprB